ncbi:MAG: NAD(P)H-hydrate dehydratase [Betaproteobacteria bacterium]|nr:NAD(P)H-hydrate dehydratase [Betaproteobacteria bacterium]
MRLKINHGTPLQLTADVRRIEARHAHEPLMERAGLAAAQLAREIAADSGKPILIFAGPGNNGGDALVVARYLKQWFFNVTVVFAGDAAKLPADAANAFKQWQAAEGTALDQAPPAKHWGLVIDGLFGIGVTRDITGRYAECIDRINQANAPVLAIDIPSGLDADSGRVHGCCVRATHTITFIGAKAGLFTLDGPDQCGTVVLDDLDLQGDGAPGRVLGAGIVEETLAPRLRNTHKGTHGSVGIIGGDRGMVGAALLAARAALKLGAGRVYAGLIARDAPLLDVMQAELMLRSADEVLKLDHLSCLVVGPGLGRAPEAAFYLRCALEAKLPLVIDADALNSIAAEPKIKTQLNQILTIKVLTPHPAEAARLLGCSTRDVQSDRIAAAQQIADRFQAHVVLKGAGSVCASPNQPWRINTSGNPGMASAGMGDVLSGIIAALLAQGTSPQRALDGAVWLHGAAADACVEKGVGPVGLSASETIDAARALFNACIGRGR